MSDSAEQEREDALLDGLAPHQGDETVELSPQDEAATVEWARTARPIDDSRTALHGEDAAALGRALLRRAGRGRPALDPSQEPGQVSPLVRFRVDPTLERRLDAYVAQRREHGENVDRSKVGRAALAEFLDSHLDSDSRLVS